MENEIQKKGIACIVCKNGDTAFFTEKNSFNVYRCKNCGLLFINPLPSQQAINDLYSSDYFSGAKKGFGYVDYDKDKEAMAAVFLKYLNLIGRFCKQKGRLLDVGAATGFFIDLAKQRGWDASGVEISQYAAEAAAKKGLNVITGTIFSDTLNENYFDVITFWDVIEHFVNPEAVFTRAWKLLKADGLIIINTPDASSFAAKIFGRRWHLLIPPEHLYLFNRKNLSEFLRQSHFEPSWSGKIGKRFTLRYASQVLANTHKFFLWKLMASFLQNNFLGRLSAPINLRDNFIMIAKKCL